MALLRKETCNLRHPMHLRHPVAQHSVWEIMLRYRIHSHGTDTATHCNTLQHVATHCTTLHLLCYAVLCSALQHVAVSQYESILVDWTLANTARLWGEVQNVITVSDFGSLQYDAKNTQYDINSIRSPENTSILSPRLFLSVGLLGEIHDKESICTNVCRCA